MTVAGLRYGRKRPNPTPVCCVSKAVDARLGKGILDRRSDRARRRDEPPSATDTVGRVTPSPGDAAPFSSATRFPARKRTTRHGRYAMTHHVDQFLQECPVCGRPLQVSSNLNGRRVTCLHCRGRFVASSSVAHSLSPTKGASFLLRRAEELIEMASQRFQLCAAGVADQSVQQSIAASPRLQSEHRPQGRSVGTLWRDLRGLGHSGP